MNPTDALEWYPITLPSKGKHYGGKLPGGDLKITPWTVAQEEIIVRYMETRKEELTHDLLRNNIQYPGDFKYEDLLVTDQFFLLVHLRAISFLPFTTLVHQCPHCKASEAVEVHFDNLSVLTSEETSPDEPFSCFLPRRKVRVDVRLLRVADTIAANSYSNKGVRGPETNRKFLYARQLVSVDGGSLKFDEKMDFISRLPVIDLGAINRCCEKQATGLSGSYSVVCSACETADERWVPPIHEDFFRPKPADIDRAVQLAQPS